MTAPQEVSVGEDDRVRLAPGVMLRQDRVRNHWQLLGPERVLVLDDIALEVVRATTGQPVTVREAIDALAAQFDAPRAEIAADVREVLADMIAKGFLTR
ncbi:pyrroloquinoline quinone biosynthesis peptide chaperone PqqD [Azospirillum rugosum]|uniref:Pyrroloquinoline quinone biosynthesis protein D n=1 Tax=Azospirillum rugosum TaxID=416170 RepID=A0ABS4SGP6_9PROT|nr:pyrroloquinoline quinone biosynthesis peptide chaperone PqqD [Azospirillum rugosum]MBP2291142.1 pyrroloquinoline quinone biosynthesis protein D [Azospirillum rugosum]MDQ0524794.1 pyrroloquinoline quinone biosynthesis protein D [Azospirillum rugosum]